MAIYDEYYVGVKPDSDKMLLGYATYVDTTAAFKKRKDSIDSWRDKSLEPISFKNEPTEGFKIVGFDSRHTTSNKVVEILDPRGFKLQVYIPDFIPLIVNSVIDKGNIVGKYLWARNGKGDNYIISENSAEYIEHLKIKEQGKPKLTTVYKDGDIFWDKNMETAYKYLGEFYTVGIKFSWYSMQPYNLNSNKKSDVCNIQDNDMKKVHFYASYTPQKGKGANAYKRVGYEIRSSKHQKLSDVTDRETIDFINSSVSNNLVFDNSTILYKNARHVYISGVGSAPSFYYSEHIKPDMIVCSMVKNLNDVYTIKNKYKTVFVDMLEHSVIQYAKANGIPLKIS